MTVRRRISSARSPAASAATAAPRAARPAGRPPTPWLAAVAHEPLPDAARLPDEVDVAVVGGGVIGVATAFWLARRGTPPLLLEARLPGWGASGRNAGLVLGGAPSLDLLREVLRAESIDAGYAEPGHLALAASEAVLASFERELAARPAAATPLEVLDRGACEDLLGMRIAPRFRGGRWMPRAGAVHPSRLVHGLAAATVRRGGAVATRCRVLRVRRGARGDGWQLRTARGGVRARQVVLACNVHGARLWPPLARVLAPSRGQVLATRPLPPLFGPGMAVDYGTLYWRQTDDGTVILGGHHELDPAAERSAREALNPRIQEALDGFLAASFPDAPPATVAWRWAGIMDVTPDGRPIVGAWPGAPGLWVAAGFGGHGLPPALGAGRALAAAVAGGALAPELAPLAPLAPDRFADAPGR